MPLNKAKNLWISAVVTGAIIAAALFLWILPRIQQITGQIATIQRERSEIDTLQKKSTVGQQQKTFDQYQESADRLKKAAVTDGTVITLIENLERIASDTGVSAQLSVQGQDDKKTTPASTATPDQKNSAQKIETPTKEIKLQLVLSGAWPNLLTMLKKVENLPSVINVTDLAFHGIGASNTAPADVKTAVNTNLPTATMSLTIPLYN